MTANLQSSGAELKSARQNILSLKLRIKTKKHSIHRLWRERDGCIDELEAEHGKHWAILKKLALADAESASVRANAELAKAEAKSARKSLNQAIENFKNSEEFKEEILEGGFTSYYIGYEDGRDTV